MMPHRMHVGRAPLHTLRTLLSTNARIRACGIIQRRAASIAASGADAVGRPATFAGLEAYFGLRLAPCAMVVVGPPGVGKRHHVQVALQQSSELQRHCIVTDLRQRPTSFDAFLRTFEQRAADALENYVASGAIASPELAKLCAAAGATPSDASAALHSIAARLQAEGRPLAATLDAMDSDESGILYGLCQLGDSAARRAQRAPPRPPLAAPEAAQQLREIAARCVSAARSATADDNGWLADLLNSASNACSRPATRGSSGLSITAAAISILRCVEERRCRRLQAAAADAATAAATALTATTATTATTAVEAVAAPGAGTDVRLEAREGREALAARLARRGGSGGRSGIAVQQFLLEALSCVAAGGRIMPHRREQADEAMLPGSQWQEDFSVQVPPHTPSPKLAVRRVAPHAACCTPACSPPAVPLLYRAGAGR